MKQSTIETPNVDVDLQKPTKSADVPPQRVDINVLKSRIQDKQNKEQKQNISIFIFFVIMLGAVGIYLST
tara:strand:+ start:1200 stop:1409 length:210 start_codon:yes stop_codon:yes gene_type:complete